MDLKQEIIDLVVKSGIENKEVVATLDEVRKLYHNPKNVGDKVLNEKEHHSSNEAEIYGNRFPLSKDASYVFYKGDWKKRKRGNTANWITYLGVNIEFKIKRKK